MDTVVEVGSPKVLKVSSRITSVIITARKMIITSLKLNCPGKKRPLRAISIKPLEKVAPTRTPRLATIITVLNEAALDPTAELRKFTASLATPTIRSDIARIKRTITKIK
jgi:hypothetical protein